MKKDFDLELRSAVETLLKRVSESIILPYFRNLTNNDIKSKSEPSDLVTIADEMTEVFLAEQLTRLIPSCQVIGEEAVYHQASIMQKLSDTGFVWLIDPIDGTANYVKGHPDFAIAIALLSSGRTVMGWIHRPIAGTTIWSARNRGSWFGQEKLCINTHNTSNSDRSIRGTHYHQGFINSSDRPYDTVQRTGSAACEYLRLATNEIQYTTFSRLKPWDHAAGILIHEEAGGYSAFLSGAPYSASKVSETGLLSAPDKLIWTKLASSIL